MIQYRYIPEETLHLLARCGKEVLRNMKWILAALSLFILLPLLVRTMIWHWPLAGPDPAVINQDEIQSVKSSLEGNIASLDRKLSSKRPASYFLVINSTLNEFTLYRGDKLIRKDRCSTGSYILLKNGEDQQWMFKSPKGEFRIQGKTTSPVWRKPDWAFVEEGLPVPTPGHHSRFEYGVLGDFALSLGDGYLIHGTLYQRFLGLPVTHGCIRLNDENLALVYRSLNIGSKVYIY